MKKCLIIIVVISVIYIRLTEFSLPSMIGGSTSSANGGSTQTFGFTDSGRQIQGAGTVESLLPDDNVARRHQKFIVRTGSGQTLLVAHNIEIAPRLSGLKVGDLVSFCGEYEWNVQGGVVHWTHHDPAGRHAAGWLRCWGQTFH
ncbi:MAG: hypothetical protein CFE30_33340 [Bradyrhizobium sp. PARBB1]|nr:MAG: hypothetical protein CFE30_33340 [Bradyrhizobium sp. PARBB1]